MKREERSMKVRDVVQILKADVLVEGDLDTEVRTACGSDMMSDVLAFVKDQSVLLTGLTNPQVVRTAEMMDIELAQEKGITVLKTPYRMFTACGLLYTNGLSGGSEVQ